MKKTNVFISGLLLCVFVLYAISPIAYDTIRGHGGDGCGESTAHVRIVKLYVLDLLLSAMMGSNAKDAEHESDAAEDHILLKKKRVISCLTSPLLVHLSLRTGKRLGMTSDREGILLASAELSLSPRSSNGYQFLYSGTAPPSC